MSQKQYNRVEKQNEIRINVFGYEDGLTFPVYVSEERFTDLMNLLIITNGGNKHYVLIKDFDRFMYNRTKHRERKHYCVYCLQCFTSTEVLGKHQTVCINVNGKQAVRMPDPGKNALKYGNFHKQLNVPFVVYADFEAITEKVDKPKVLGVGVRPRGER